MVDIGRISLKVSKVRTEVNQQHDATIMKQTIHQTNVVQTDNVCAVFGTIVCAAYCQTNVRCDNQVLDNAAE